MAERCVMIPSALCLYEAYSRAVGVGADVDDACW